MTAGAAVTLRRSRWIPWIFIGGFLVVVGANAIMVAFAVGSFTGLTTSEPYTKGLRYNDEIRQAEAQARLGWRAAARFVKTAALTGRLELEVTDRTGAALADAHVVAVLARPVEKNRDFLVALRAAGHGRYAAQVVFPLPGAWDVTYRIARGGDVLEARERVQVE